MTPSGPADERQARLRALPSIDRLLLHPATKALLTRYRRTYVARHCRDMLAEIRSAIEEGRSDPTVDPDVLATQLEARILADSRPGLARVVNATGTILHTNLGRALLPASVVEAIATAAMHPLNLEYDLARGERGRREEVVSRRLGELTGAEAATVVNNNAAAVLLCLNTFASGREVLVSRGELIEIGGSFRLPDIMARSGAILREVGTTNRTHPADYENAITANTALILKAHTSNYRIVGFSSSVDLPELVEIGRRHGIIVMEDLGSGALVDLRQHGLPAEPMVGERLALGADVVTFSGDKVLGGPQAGLIVGARSCIDQVARNPLHRALRCGKLTIAALEATLRLYQQAPDITEAIPALKAFTRSVDEIAAFGRGIVPRLAQALGPEFRVALCDEMSQIGSGALPTEEIPTKAIAIEHTSLGAERIASRFRAARPPIVGRIKDGRFLLDLRAIFDADEVIPQWA
jgi:L-seryl-tRNA(Ser) seleniumtransferase